MSNPSGRFTYAFGALLQRQKWRLDARLTELASAARDRVAKADALARMKAECVSLGHGPVDGSILNPGWAQSRLSFLRAAQVEVAGRERALADIDERCGQLRRACQREQSRLDALGKHRDRAYAAFEMHQARQASRTTDQVWLARWKRRPDHREGIPE